MTWIGEWLSLTDSRQCTTDWLKIHRTYRRAIIIGKDHGHRQENYEFVPKKLDKLKQSDIYWLKVWQTHWWTREWWLSCWILWCFFFGFKRWLLQISLCILLQISLDWAYLASDILIYIKEIPVNINFHQESWNLACATNSELFSWQLFQRIVVFNWKNDFDLQVEKGKVPPTSQSQQHLFFDSSK